MAVFGLISAKKKVSLFVAFTWYNVFIASMDQTSDKPSRRSSRMSPIFGAVAVILIAVGAFFVPVANARNVQATSILANITQLLNEITQLEIKYHETVSPSVISGVANNINSLTSVPSSGSTTSAPSGWDSLSGSSPSVSSVPNVVSATPATPAVPSVSAVAASSAVTSPQLTINGVESATYAIGSAWTLNLTSAVTNTSFTICALVSGSQTCTPNWGKTNASGGWSQSGSFSSATNGTWKEWIVFSTSTVSNQVSFSVTSTAVAAAPAVSITALQGYNPATSIYTNGTAIANTYLILYGKFAASGNSVVIDGKSVTTSYQSAAQLNVSLSGIAVGNHAVAVKNASGTSATASFTVTPASATTTPTSTTLIGPYFWGGSVTGVSESSMLAEGKELADDLGSKVIRISMSARADEDYENGSCIPNFTLAGLAERSDFNAILTDPQFSTVIITAFDGTTFGNCVTKSYLDPSFYTAANTQKIETEYTNLADYLKQFSNKKFIIANWEGDNDAYCGSSESAVVNGSSTCPGAVQNLAGLQKWFAARYAGIKAANAPNVFSGIEFNSVTGLHGKGLPSVLYNVIPNVSADYYLYSSYESINVSAAQFTSDINTIRSVVHSNNIIIGEMGFQVGAFGDATTTAERLGQMIAVVQQENLPYGIVWALLNDPPGMGIYSSTGAPTVSGIKVKSALSPLGE